jgi:hypothetical protein
MKLKLLLTFTLLCNVLLLNATTNSGSKTDNPNNEIVANEITCSVSTTSFCSGSSVTVTFTASGTYVSGNVFTAQLSDASGSFASPVSIGTLTAIASGTFSGLIPNNSATGSGYRIRVIASNPSTIGTDNGVNITVNQLPNPILAGNSNICVGLTSVFVSNVTGGTWSSGNTSIATVNSITGVVTGVSSGVAIINYTVSGTGTCPNATASRTVTVSPQPNAGVISGNQNICAGSTSTFASTVAGGTWSSANTSIATINSTTGVVAGVSPGTTTISYIAIGIGGCPNVMATRTVTVNSIVTPNFFSAFSLCSGSVAPVLATTSVNGITGTWLPSTISNTTSGTYSFTPTIGQCATTATLNVTVIPKVTPTFTPIAPICSGTPLNPLPTTSNDGITGTWSPALNNKATTTYTFTPTPGLCANTTALTITVIALPSATSSPNNLTICSGETANIDLSSSQSGTTFNWTAVQTGVLGAFSATGNSITQILQTSGNQQGTVVYTITPVSNGCVGVPITAIVNVNPKPEIFGSGATTICSGESTNINLFSSILGTQLSWTVIPTGVTGATAGTGSTINDILLAGATVGTAVYTISSSLKGCQGNSFVTTVTINPLPLLEPMPNVLACSSYTLPVLLKGSYYSGVAGTGNIIAPETVITNSTLLSVFFNDGFCSASYPLSITIIPETKPEIITENDSHDLYIENTTIVQSLLLDSQLSNEYSFQWYENDILIDGATNSSYLVNTVSQNADPRNFTVKAIKGICESTSSIFEVNQTPVPAPSGDRFQSFTQGQTLDDIVVIGSNIQWYADATANRKASSPLPLNTLLVNNTTYYASQTINGFESQTRLPVTVQVALSNHSFAFKDLQVSPNPIIDVLNIKSKEIVKKVTVYNTLGQEVSHKEGNGLEFKLDFSNLVSGNYFVKVASENKQQVLKVVKK